ncbi:MAG: hypothetical protein AABX01_02105 [Candidatus Micrarchaeota archaeon]
MKILNVIKEKLPYDYSLIVLTFLTAAIIIILTAFYPNPYLIAIISVCVLILTMMKEYRDQKKDDIEEALSKLSNKKMDEIHSQITINEIESKKREKVIMKLMKKGVINEDDMIAALSQEAYFIFYHFNRAFDNKYVKYLPENRKLAARILEKLGFVPVGAFSGSYFFHIINSRALPTDLQNIGMLEAYIKKEAVNHWTELDSNIKTNPSLYEKYTENDKTRGNLVYFLGKIFPSNLSMGYLNFSSFDTRFLPHLSKFLNSEKIEINVKKFNDLISLASLDFFIDSIERKDRAKILENETEMRAELGIKKIYDYANLSKEDLIRVLSKYFTNEKSIKFSDIILQSANDSCPIIQEFA